MPNLDLELSLHSRGYSLIAGIDEAGRGPLAGPVVAAAVVLPLPQDEPGWLKLVDDSKTLTPLQRRKALSRIETNAIAIGVGISNSSEIDSVGIGEATKRAMIQAINNLPIRPSYLLIDFVKLPEIAIPFHSFAHGDSISYSIAAASIVAKVTRDRLMDEADHIYPGYEFSRNKGYPTAQHLRLLNIQGPCPIHRRSFRPLRTQR
mgnify:CR=1 FL=1